MMADMIWAAIMERLLVIPEYQKMFASAFPDVQMERLRFQHAANAIAAYEMSAFTFTDSPWDRFLLGDDSALSTEAARGARLFFGEAGCSACHNGRGRQCRVQQDSGYLFQSGLRQQ